MAMAARVLEKADAIKRRRNPPPEPTYTDGAERFRVVALDMTTDMTTPLHDYWGSGWGPWALSPTNATLVCGSWVNYYIDLERCLNSAQTLDWLFQIQGKVWADDEVIAGMIRALDDVMVPQANLCSMGSSKKVTKAWVRARCQKVAELRPDLCVPADY